MLSNLLVTSQRFVVVIDELGEERVAQKFLRQLLREQGQDETTLKILPLNRSLRGPRTLQRFINELDGHSEAERKWNVLLPPFSDLLCYQRAAVLLQFLHTLRHCAAVKRTFLWISTQHVMHEHAAYLIAACEHMADLVLHLATPTQLSLLIRKPGGGVMNRRYAYKKTRDGCLVELVQSNGDVTANEKNAKHSAEQHPSQMGTFKIELEEEELVARNALKMPYERATEATESNIIYTPDAADDFDDDDPDEDLCI